MKLILKILATAILIEALTILNGCSSKEVFVKIFSAPYKPNAGYPEYIVMYCADNKMDIYTPYYTGIKVCGDYSLNLDTIFFRPSYFFSMKTLESIKYDYNNEELDTLGLSYHRFLFPRAFILKKRELIEITDSMPYSMHSNNHYKHIRTQFSDKPSSSRYLKY